jgi:hypothetical protein
MPLSAFELSVNLGLLLTLDLSLTLNLQVLLLSKCQGVRLLFRREAAVEVLRPLLRCLRLPSRRLRQLLRCDPPIEVSGPLS